MKALVTGATGFIGRNLVSQLETAGCGCRCLVRSISGAARIPVLENTELIEGDILVPQSLVGMAQGMDYVFHLAGEGHVSATSERHYRNFQRVNVQGTENVVRACIGEGISKLVHFSSTAAMGLINKHTVDEETECQPTTPYQRSKYEGESVALNLGLETDVPVVVVRPCMVIGAGGLGEFSKMVRLMARGWFPKVGRGANLTPVIHVQDVVNGAILAAERGTPGEIYLLVGGSHPMDEIRHIVVSDLEVSPPYPYVPTWAALSGAWLLELLSRAINRVPIVTRRNIASTVADRVFSIEKARQQLGFTPKVNLAEAVRETVSWYQNTGII